MKFKKILPVLALSTTPVAFVLAASSCQKNDKVDTEFIAKNAVRIYVNNDDTWFRDYFIEEITEDKVKAKVLPTFNKDGAFNVKITKKNIDIPNNTLSVEYEVSKKGAPTAKGSLKTSVFGDIHNQAIFDSRIKNDHYENPKSIMSWEAKVDGFKYEAPDFFTDKKVEIEYPESYDGTNWAKFIVKGKYRGNDFRVEKKISKFKAFTLEQYTNGLIIKLNDIQNKFTFQVKEDISEFAITNNLKKIDPNSSYKITKIERNMLSGFSINVDFLYKDRVIFGKKYELSGFKQLKDNVFSIAGHNDFWNYAIDELDTNIAFLGTFLPDYKAAIADAQKDDKEGKITFNFLVTSQDGNTKYAEVKNLTLNSLVLPEYDKDHKVLVQWKDSRTTVVRDKFLANITKIGEKAFEGKTIESIVIPSTLVEIGERAFLNCTKMNNFDLIIPNTVTKLGNGLFVGAHIKSVTLPSNLTSLPSDTFKSAVINALTLSDTIETINSNAFNEAKINKLVLSKALKEIPTDAFNGIQLSEGLVIPDKVTNIKDGAFRNSKLKSITLPASVTSIGKNVFQGVTFSGDVTIPATIKTIESGAFLNASVKNLVFDKTLEDIKNGAFSGIKIEGKITLPAKFNDKDKLKAIGIADADIAKCVFI